MAESKNKSPIKIEVGNMQTIFNVCQFEALGGRTETTNTEGMMTDSF
jgi:serine protease inhibitor ecotin